MKKIFATLLAASMMLIGTQAFAQFVPGAGYLYASEKTSNSDAVAHHGFYLGASYNIPLVAGLGIAPGFYANMLFSKLGSYSVGGATAGASISGNTRELSLNLPVNLNYRYSFGAVGVMAFAGPTFQYCVLNKSNINADFHIPGFTYTDGQEINRFDPNESGALIAYNPFNIYIGGGIGIQLGDLLFTVGYDRSLLDLDKRENSKTARNVVKAGINFAF